MSENIENTEETKKSESTEEVPQKLYYDALSVARRTSQIIHFVEEHDKPSLLGHFIKNNEDVHVVVLIKTKKEADSLAKYLVEQDIKALSVHSNKSAKEAQTSIESFNKDETDVLIMTDMFLQSQTLTDLTHVISYNIPSEASHYYERLKVLEEKGEGIAFVCEEEEHLMDTIQIAMKVEILEIEPEGFTPTARPETVRKDKIKKPRHKKTKKSTKKKDIKDIKE